MRYKPLNQFQYLPLFLLLLMNLPALVFPQSGNEMVDKLALPLNKVAQHISREQVYIQLSKGSYEAGEDLWFKAYLLNSLSFAPSALSKTLYVRVIREGSTKAFWQERYEIRNGSVSGHVYLPDTLKEGNYLLDAFTTASFYKEDGEFKAFRRFRVVQDYKALQTTSSDNKKESGRPNQKIQFGVFPEGGKLISGVQGKLAFKAVDTTGSPIDVRGILLENGKALQEFKSVHDGMGSVIFTPLAGKKYTLQLKTSALHSTIQLPEVHADGISLRLSSKDTSNLEFTVARPSGLLGTKVYFRAQMRGKTCFLSSAFLDGELKIQVLLNNFAYQGIAEFTVFNDQFMPVAERLVYVHPQKKLYISTELSKPTYTTREKAVLNIKTRDENGKPVAAELGISIYDKLYENAGDPVNLLTYSFLSTQLRGRIYAPAFYFDERNKGREESLDLLLLTQGWRNYVWDEENLKTEGIKQAVIFDETFGSVKFTKRLKQAPQSLFVNSFLSDEQGKPKNSELITPGLGGKFYVSSATLKVGEGANIYLKPMGLKEFEPRIILSDPFLILDTITKAKRYLYPYQSLVVKLAVQSGLTPTMDSRVFRLKEVKINGKGNQIFRDKYLGKLDSLAKIDPNGVFVCKHGQLNGYWQGYHCAAGPQGQCRDTLTTSPVEGRSYAICRYEPTARPNFWVLRETTFTEYHNPNNGMSEEEILKRNNISKLSGYYPQKEFYQPNYDKEPNGDGLPDARNTLVWAPSMITDEKGEATVSFFCSDINSGFIVQAEGLTKGGLLGSQKLEFRVLEEKPPATGK